jgi:alanyl-tRNA synthetase
MTSTSTERLHYEDSLLTEFRARVISVENSVAILDRTAFYPESGGQMADRGTIGGVPVVDVQVRDDGVVEHRLDGTLAPGEYDAKIDRARRRVHMALHTGQHMLSRALADVAAAETVSSRLGETGCTIDVDLEKLDEAALARAEALVNSVIDDDAPVRAWFPPDDELRALPLRRAPKVTEHIRIVAIGDFDFSPCGGTHCLRTAQVGLVRVTGLERYKGKMRVTFAAGRRARDELGAQADLIKSLGRDLTCGPAEIPTALAKLRRELTDTREALGQARGRLAASVADVLAAGSGPIVEVFDDADADFVRAVAKRLAGRPLILGARGDAGMHVLAAGHPDCGALIKKLTGGKGGGRREQAEGRLPRDADLVTLAREALS